MNLRRPGIHNYPEDGDGSFPAARLGISECVSAKSAILCANPLNGVYAVDTRYLSNHILLV